MLFLLFLVIWLIFSKNVTVEIMMFGLVVSTIVFLFAKKHLGYEPVRNYKMARTIWLSFRYLLIWIWEAGKANIIVVKIVFSRKIKLDQLLVYFRPHFRSNVAHVTLANSITMAPGSVTIELDDDLYCVHFMDRVFWDGCDNFIFVKLLREIEEGEIRVEG